MSVVVVRGRVEPPTFRFSGLAWGRRRSADLWAIRGPSSGGVRRDFDDEVGIEGRADPLQQRDRGHHPACLQA
jgi:hypothetical protein